MWLIAISGALAGFGGAELVLIGETDGAGNELVLDMQVTPWRHQRKGLDLRWGQAGLGWSWMSEDQRLDQLELSVLDGRAVFGSGTTGASFGVGEVLLDADRGVSEFGFVRGGMGGTALEQRVDWSLGADLHLRRVDQADALLLGLPLQVRFAQPLPYRTFAGASAQLRPSFGLVGEPALTWDGGLSLEAGVHAVQEEQASLEVVLSASSMADSFTALEQAWVHQLGLGARARF